MTNISNAACSQKKSEVYGVGFIASMIKKRWSRSVRDISKTSSTKQIIGKALLYTAIDMLTRLVFFETKPSRRIS